MGIDSAAILMCDKAIGSFSSLDHCRGFQGYQISFPSPKIEVRLQTASMLSTPSIFIINQKNEFIVIRNERIESRSYKSPKRFHLRFIPDKTRAWQS